ncbi:hypothetical protein BJL95_11495 [Methylomonas sp. LWB]|uniref:DUF2149 domain-containing protein n=1 Tax=Methylomonas sp. LWB TaxID=1905845 RepID=UPI0008D97C73|nr:DUF2149 domain-containing protein [Methylomonas sp. LWB]OHX36380.1 hypothetical protein BJL95_11495 [Methylomonas sp. LWB]
MRYLRRHRRFESAEPLEDPIAGVANLFDASIVFIVSMMLALFMAYNMMDLLDPHAEVTMTKKGADGQIEVVTRKGKEIKVSKVTDKKLSGEGERLGTAYRLVDGRVVYVPQSE